MVKQTVCIQLTKNQNAMQLTPFSNLRNISVALAMVALISNLSWGQQTVNISNTTLNTCDALIYDDGGPTGDYSTNGNYVMTICAASGTDLYVTVNDLGLGTSFAGDEDEFYIYEGTGTGGTVLFNGTTGAVPSAILSTNTGCITIEMLADPGSFFPTDPGSGFEVAVTCVLPETCSDGILNNGEVQIDCGGPNCVPCYNFTDCGEMVVNGDFETVDATGCANMPTSEIRSNETSCLGWYGTTLPNGSQSGITPDYWTISGCGVSPNITGSTGGCNSGSGALGFFPGGEEVQSQLAAPLIAGKEYCVSIDLVSGQAPGAATSDFFIWIHGQTFAGGTGIYDLDADNGGNINIVNGPVGATPQYVHPGSDVIGTTCRTITTSFCATGGEEYVVLGGQGQLSLAYLIADNFSITESCPITFDSQITASGTPDCTGSCVDLYAEVSNQGGGCQVTNDFTFQWYENGVLMAGQTDDTLLNVCPTATTTYSVEITYDAGCETLTKPESQTTITFNCGISVIATATPDILCEGECTDLEAILTPASTTATYTWVDQGSGAQVGTGNLINVCPLATTTYEVTVVDGASTETAIVTVTVNPLPVVDAGPDQVLCDDGTQVTLSGSGAANYTWDNGVVDGQAFNPLLGTTTYTVTGTDANGCVNTDQVDVTVNPVPTPSIIGALTYCPGSTATLSADMAYASYNWSTGATTQSVNVTDADNPITLTVTDANGCSATTASVLVVENNLVTTNTTVEICQGESATIHGNVETVAGVYSQTYQLASGCDSTSNVTLVVNALPTVDAGLDQILCDDGTQVTLSGSGAATYVWDNGVIDGQAFNPVLGTTTYTVTGTDANGCVNTDQVDVTVNPVPVVDAGLDQVLCDDGTQVTLTGTGADTYVWDNGVVDGQAFTPSVGTITYTVIGTDANGCTNTDQVDVTVNPLPTIDAGLDQALCDDGTQVTLSATSPTLTNFTWDNGVVDGQPFTPIVGTTTYTVTGTDANGCTNSDQVDVTVTPIPVVDAGLDQVLCDDGTQVTLSGSGATTYVWDNGVIDGQPFTPTVGTITYTVTGTTNGCSNTDQVDVTVNALPDIDAGPDQVVCDGDQVTLSATSTLTNFTWDNGVNDGVAFTPAVGTLTYTVSVTDANGCTNSDQVDVTVVAFPSITPVVNNVSCFGDCDGSVTLNSNNPGGSFVYTWGQGVAGGQNGVADNLCSGNYTVVVADALGGCAVDVDYTIDEPENVLPQLVVENTSGCAPVLVQFEDVSTVNPGDVASIIVNFGDGTSETFDFTGTSFSHEYLTPGTFTVSITVITYNNCSYTVSYQNLVEVYDNPIADFNIANANEITEWNPVADLINMSSANATIFQWTLTNGDPATATTEDVLGVTFPYDATGTYPVTLHVTTDHGCTDEITMDVVVLEELIYYIPNTFTPDGDEFNQTFQPVFTSGFDPFDFNLVIFNRWGEVIFESHDASIGWDGTYNGQMVQDGTYVWKVEFKTTRNDERKTDIGHVNILR